MCIRDRHVDMLAIAGAIGTGLVIGTGTALKRGGPGSLLIAFIFTGSLLIGVLMSLAEMASFAPMDKSFSGYATRYVDPALGFATGWNYFLKYAIALASELSAIGLLVQYWREDLSIAIFIVVFLVVLLSLNFMNIKFYGEVEFWSALLKFLVLIICFVTGLVLTCGGGPSKETIGFRYWREYAFVPYLVKGTTGRFLGWWACVIQSCYAYIGSETIGVVFGEAPNPKKTIPAATRNVIFRITGFYIVGVLILGLIISPHDKTLANAKTSDASGSPFVIAFTNAGIKGLPSFINAMLIMFIASAANTALYVCSRTAYGLAKDGMAPKIFLAQNRYGVPFNGCLLAGLISLLSFMNISNSSSVIFGYLTSSVTVFGTLNWLSVLISYIGYERARVFHDVPRDRIPFRMWFQPYSAYVCLFFVSLIIFFNGYSAFIAGFKYKSFIVSYIGIAVFIGNTLFWKFWKKSAATRPEDLRSIMVEEAIVEVREI